MTKTNDLMFPIIAGTIFIFFLLIMTIVMYVKLYKTTRAFEDLKKEYHRIYNILYPPVTPGPEMISVRAVGIREVVTQHGRTLKMRIHRDFWKPIIEPLTVEIKYYKDRKRMWIVDYCYKINAAVLCDVDQLNYKVYLEDEIWPLSVEEQGIGYLEFDEEEKEDVFVLMRKD